MDNSKKEVLIKNNYQIMRVCSNCTHSKIRAVSSWGICRAFKYNYEKHTEKERYMSVNITGTCNAHEWDNAFIKRLDQNWSEFCLD